MAYEEAGGEPEGGWIRSLVPYLWAHRAKVVVAVLASAVGMAAAALIPLVQKLVVDDVIVHHRRSLTDLLLMLAAIGAVRFVGTIVRRTVGGRVSIDVGYDLRRTLFDHLQGLDFARHDELATGQLVSRANTDLTMVQQFLAWLPMVLGNGVQLLLSLVVMFLLSPLLAMLTLAVVLATFAVAFRMRRVVYVSTWDANQREAEMTAVAEEAISGVRVVKGFGQERREVRHMVEAVERLFGGRVRNLRYRSRFTSVLQSLPSVGQLAVLLLGGWLAIHGHLTLGTLLAFFSYLTQLAAPARILALFLSAAQQARAGAERLTDLLDLDPKVTDPPGALQVPEGPVAIEFDHVSFGYTPDHEVLSDFTLRIQPGESVALVGGSGSGKSTVAQLVGRFYDVRSGSVRLGGFDVREASLASLRAKLGMVFEESFLFSDTVRANLTFGRPDASDEDVHTAARAALAEAFILELPAGYDTEVGERGVTLSGGQRQRLALARALLRHPDVLLLDDATASVDAEVEEQIHDELRALLPGCTTLLVAHRRSTIALADRIVVLDQGRVVDEGSHEELVARCPAYVRLVEQDAEEETVDPETATFDDPPVTAPLKKRTGRPAFVPTVALRAPSPVRGGGRGGGGMGFVGPANEALLADVEALAPVRDLSEVDSEVAAANPGGLRIMAFLGPWRRELLIGLGLVVLDALATLAGPFLVKSGIDRGVATGSLATLVVLSSVYLAVTLFDWWDMWAETLVTGRTAERALVALRVRVFAHLQRLGLDFYDREMAGRLLTRMTSDVDTLSNLIQTGLINAVVSLVSFVGMAAVLLVLSPLLALAVLALVPPLVGATHWFRMRSASAYDRQRDRIALVNADLQEKLNGVRETQAFQREEVNSHHFGHLSDDYRAAGIEVLDIQARYFAFVELLSVTGTGLVLGLGARFANEGALTVGVVVAFLLYLTQFFAPIQQLSQVFDTWQKAAAGSRKLDGLLSTTPTVVAPERPAPPVSRGEIRLEDVHFIYANQQGKALSGVTLDIAAGQQVALVGRTGSGKSTLVKLLARFHDPTEGEVLVDGISLRAQDPVAYRQRLGYVPQEPFLFAATVRDNIAYGRPDAREEQVVAAAKAVGVHRTILALPDGYDHWLLERGRSLSTGERQLLCLARALLVDPAILLLDEATSNLDLGTERRVNDAMQTLARGRTTVVIAHRLETARRAQCIVVMARGQVVQVGSHEELLATPGRYRELWTAFSGEATAEATAS